VGLPTQEYDPLAPFTATDLGAKGAMFYYGGSQNDINDPHQTPSAPATQLPVMCALCIAPPRLPFPRVPQNSPLPPTPLLPFPTHHIFFCLHLPGKRHGLSVAVLF